MIVMDALPPGTPHPSPGPYQAIFAHSKDAMFLTAPDGRILAANPAACLLFGGSEAELCAAGRTGIVDTGDPRLGALLRERDRVGHAVGRLTHRRLDGSRFEGETTSVVFTDTHGNLRTSRTTRDITALVAAETTLRESEARYRTVLAALDEGVVLQGADGAIIAANASAERILGFGQAQLLGKTSTDPQWEAIHEDGSPFPGETHPAAVVLRTGIAQANVVIGTHVADGTLRWLSVNARPLVHPGATLPYAVVASFHDITARKQAEQEFRHAALHDPLTGAANRRLFMDRLTQALLRTQRRDDRGFAVLFLDFDHFKSINDGLGHEAGDALLREAARRFGECIRPYDIVARFGGDEFAMLLDDLHDPLVVARVAQRVQAAMRAPFLLAAGAITVTLSIGTALSTPDHTRPEDVLRDADRAQYRAKHEGGNRIVSCDGAHHARAVVALGLEGELSHALEHGEFRLVFQPLVALATGTPTGFEALVRWQHPARGEVPPGEFIAAMERQGLTDQLDAWVMRAACAQLGTWQRGHPQWPRLTMNVNVSPRTFRDPHLATRIAQLIAEHGLAPGQLQLEITERLLLEPTVLTTQLLAELQQLGVGVQVDDFGTGYSSLIYLHRFPFDGLKLDREFITGERAVGDEIVRAVVTMAHGLKLAVVAEGIETAAQAARLVALGCDHGQGYLFGRPMTGGEAETYLCARPVGSGAGAKESTMRW